jgi:hypothetical protein
VHELPARCVRAATGTQRTIWRKGSKDAACHQHRCRCGWHCLALALLVFLRKPVVDAGEAGLFANDCCGTVKLADGEMLLNDQQTVSYSVARDADGPYILPRFDIGIVADQGLDVDGTRSVRKLRLDRLPSPTTITIFEGSPYVFTRSTPRLRK